MQKSKAMKEAEARFWNPDYRENAPMLHASKDFGSELSMYCLLRGWDAYCHNTGVYMMGSRGNAKRGNAPKWTVIYAGIYEKKFRFHIRAWDVYAAIDAANERLAKLDPALIKITVYPELEKFKTR